MVSGEDHARVCVWTRVLAVSGVRVPWELYQHLNTHAQPSLSTLRDLIAIVAANGSPAEIKDYAEICNQLFVQLASILVGNASCIGPTDLEAEALQQALLLMLKAYGAPDEDIASSSLTPKVQRQAPGYSHSG